jgi:hypothetical protein
VSTFHKYIQLTKDWPNPHKHLWLHARSRVPLDKARFSYFFKALIRISHPIEGRVHVHQTRKLATSLAFHAGLPLEDICRRAM